MTIPSDLTGLQFWFKADALALSDAAPVTSWTDSSGNGHTATEATNTPSFETNEVNSLPVVRFDGTNDRLATNAVNHGIGSGDFTFYAVVRSTNVSASYKAIMTTVAGAVPGLYIHSSKINLYWSSDHNFATTLVNNTWYLVCIQRSGTTISCYINGVLDATTFTLSTSMANDLWYIGNENAGTAATFNGDQAELALYNTLHGTTDRQSLESYFSTKYAFFAAAGAASTTAIFRPRMPLAILAQ